MVTLTQRTPPHRAASGLPCLDAGHPSLRCCKLKSSKATCDSMILDHIWTRFLGGDLYARATYTRVYTVCKMTTSLQASMTGSMTYETGHNPGCHKLVHGAHGLSVMQCTIAATSSFQKTGLLIITSLLSSSYISYLPIFFSVFHSTSSCPILSRLYSSSSSLS